MDFADQVAFVVGRPLQTTIHAPKKLITARSGYVKKACEDPKHASDGLLHLPFGNPDSFSRYLHVLHFDEVGAEEDEKTYMTLGYLVRLVHCYLLAEQLDDPASMDIFMDSLLRYVKEPREQEEVFVIIRLIYSQPSPNTHPLKRLLVDWAVECWSFARLAIPSMKESERVFILDAAQAFAEKRDAEGKTSKADLESKNYFVAVEKA